MIWTFVSDLCFGLSYLTYDLLALNMHKTFTTGHGATRNINQSYYLLKIHLHLHSPAKSSGL